ncbi:acyl-CoA thioesterase [Cedecea sp. NFIX57]|uniref:acyl-CoA thioesterase n=1 Tax=Cedecea sp. NFIX57 TaxID=1566286 RepID=UPI000A09F561|nr:acyl-CoA thioesterase [Cedecea sp. NFIX57]SMG60653.1 acyl-CoA thioester hydrolase [Cedecea sp. NFIX57]
MFTKKYAVMREHIDFQDVMDGLYYPFYMEWCRHAFMEECLGIDIKEEATKNNMYILTEYKIRFKKSIRADAKLTVTCCLKESEKRSRFYFEQKIIIDDTEYAEAVFEATCIGPSGRPYIPTAVTNHLINS